MNDINHLYDLIGESSLTLIGYSFRQERIKDAFISKLNYVQIDEIDSSFSLHSYIRDLKLDSILNGDDILSPVPGQYVIFDLNNIKSSKRSENSDGTLFEIPKFIRKLTEDIRTTSMLFKFKPILICSMYQTLIGQNDPTGLNFVGGSSPMYASDLVLRFSDDGVSVIKNRYSGNFTIPYGELKNSLYI